MRGQKGDSQSTLFNVMILYQFRVRLIGDIVPFPDSVLLIGTGVNVLSDCRRCLFLCVLGDG